MKKVRLRYAPSPTGYLHIGNTRTALMNFLFAKHHKGDFIVRIEDTDFERNVEDAIESQFDNLDWLSITPDESFLKPVKKYGMYKQTEKLEVYKDYANKLIEKGFAYKCFCSSEKLEEEREKQKQRGVIATRYAGTCRELSKEEISKNESKEFNIRFKVEGNKEYSINDMVRGEIKFESNEIGDWVMIKSNGVATYNFAVVIDDFDMEISHVVRGEEHISNTPKQLMVFEAFKWTAPTYGHMTLIVDDNRKKLSKRSGNQDFFISQYKSLGYLPEAIFNYISLLGWSPGGEEEIFTKEELIKIFDEKRFSKSPSTFDVKKLQWLNSVWMKKIEDKEYLTFVKEFVDSKYDLSKFSEDEFNQLLLLFKKEIEFGIQINDHLDLFFIDRKVSSEDLKTLKAFEYKNLNKALIDEMSKINFDEQSIKDAIKKVGQELNIKGKDLFMPTRIMITTQSHGPELAKIIMLLGKEKVINNLKGI
ncbi:glutamate--tRNA ligase [Spiroplasma endosymbiont of Othius punctulatus]|uniref:glutamate--tRNA ligase n=1 Tax=Spiroplasma endosymbiont of Othius punctulatus TaxID=3066289 RepID=UPI0030CB1E9F